MCAHVGIERPVCRANAAELAEGFEGVGSCCYGGADSQIVNHLADRLAGGLLRIVSVFPERVG